MKITRLVDFPLIAAVVFGRQQLLSLADMETWC